jgi:hypothetical protein
MKTVALILDTRDNLINITHNDSDSGMWIVRYFKKVLWFKIRISSDWFNDERQATAFALGMKQRQIDKLQIS